MPDNETPTVTSKPSTSINKWHPYDLKTITWSIGNFATQVVVIATAVAVAHNPLNILLANQIRSGKYFDFVSSGKPGSRFAILGNLFRGLSTNLSGQVAKSTYVTSAKKVMASEEVVAFNATAKKTGVKVQEELLTLKEEKLIVGDNIVEASGESVKNPSHGETATEAPGETIKISKSMHELNAKQALNKKERYAGSTMPLVAAITFGDVAINQVSSNIYQIKALAIETKPYKWNSPANFFSLSRLGFGMRYTSSLANFTTLCLVENYYSQFIPIADPTVRHFVSGAASGMTAAFCTFPFTYFTDYSITKVTVNEEKLVVPKLIKIISAALQEAKQLGIKKTTKELYDIAIKQLPLRVLRTSVTFAIVAAISESLSGEPLNYLFDNSGDSIKLKKLGLFATKKDIPQATIQEVESQQANSNINKKK